MIDTAGYQGRKVAVFDGDGTVLGQCPHYLADECLYGEAQKHPEKKPDIIQKWCRFCQRQGYAGTLHGVDGEIRESHNARRGTSLLDEIRLGDGELS